ncbi:MAG TPA: YceI family protein [Ferruginibacter sp.]|nr:YceI family protein [Ferruginibacter sp.]
MKKASFISFLLFFFYLNGTAQLYFTKNGFVSFFSSTTMEDIKADNNQVISILNSATGELQFSLLNNAFHFKKALMEEHFNEDYIESAKYPKSSFKGSISNLGQVDLSKDGVYTVSVTGNLTIHGVTKAVTVPGKLTVKGGTISASAIFKVSPKDYNITIPAAVRNNIAKEIEITVTCSYEKKS